MITNSINALGMMPETDTYGPWPASGEIDIAESRGNGVDYEPGGRNLVASTLHWGKSMGPALSIY
jgi:hypothetical protein